jgi:iron complex outermembrane receptor protein
MNKIIQLGTNKMHFNKWSRKAYAVFNSLGREIKISAIVVTYTLVFLPVSGHTQTDTILVNKNLDLDEIVVSAQRSASTYRDLSRIVNTIEDSAIYYSPAETVHDILDFQSAVDIRQRGPLGIQADLSIRGGSFDQSMVLLNGMNITDPQTGHFSLNIPLNLEDAKKIEVLKGPGSRVFGPNAFTGAVNIVTTPADTNYFEGKLITGEYGLYRVGVSGNFLFNSFKNYISVSTSGANGYAENTDFKQVNLFYHGVYHITDNSSFSLQAGYKNKAFGAQSFYTPEYPEQYEENENVFLGIKGKTGGKFKVKPVFYWRRHKDRFELFRESDDYYKEKNGFFITAEGDTAKYTEGIYESWNYYSGHNYHLTDVLGASADLVYESAFGSTSVGFGFRYENIISNVLGEPLKEMIKVEEGMDEYYHKSYSRIIFNNYFEQTFHFNRFSGSVGLLASMSREFSDNVKVYPGIDASYRINPYLKVYSSYNRSLRLPTFTDMFYSGPDNIGNKDLKPELMNSYETGTKLNSKYISGHFSFFYNEGEDIIAWVKEIVTDKTEKWKTHNLTNVYTRGFEISVRTNFEFLTDRLPFKSLLLNYATINQDKGAGIYDSKYTLNYLENEINFRLVTRLADELYFSFSGHYNDRAGKYFNYNMKKEEYDYNLSYEPYFLFDSKLSWSPKNWEFYFAVNNLLNTDYVDYGNLPVPGRWIKLGITNKLFF